MTTGAERLRRLRLSLHRRWHRFEISGLETLLAPGPRMVAAYHGVGLPIDLQLLQLAFVEHAGYLPRMVGHRGLWHLPLVGRFMDDFGFVPGDGPALRGAIERGETIIVAPGGTLEGLRPFTQRHRVKWGERRGYLRLAAELGVPVLPVATPGVDRRFIGLNHGQAFGRWLRLPHDWPAWLAVGMTGPWPLTLPFPVRLTMRVGTPVRVSDFASVEDAHTAITAQVRALLTASYPNPGA